MRADEPDDDRYVHYRQEQLLADAGWAAILEHLRSMPAPALPDSGPCSEFAKVVRRWNEFQPSTGFEIPSSHALFQPILDDVEEAASALAIRPVAPIRLATSTEMGAGPVSMPTVGGHYLFVGPGTSWFCNYWAKVVAWHVDAVRRTIGTRPLTTRGETHAALRIDSGPLLAALKLAIDYCKHGSVVGSGILAIPQSANGLRHELLTAMETFAVAHEYSHFVAEERNPSACGHDLEYFCDQLALQLARFAPSARESWSNFVGAGAIAFFAAVKFCGDAEAVVLGRVPPADGSHPPLAERISAITWTAVQRTDPEQRTFVNAYLTEFRTILDNFFDEGLQMLRGAMESPDG